jgi:hypothetical protein
MHYLSLYLGAQFFPHPIIWEACEGLVTHSDKTLFRIPVNDFQNWGTSGNPAKRSEKADVQRKFWVLVKLS